MNQERRTRPRYQLDADISVNEAKGRTIDISANGVFFETALPLVAGDELELVLPFQQSGPDTQVQCRAQVVRVEARGPIFGVAVTYEPVGFSVSA